MAEDKNNEDDAQERKNEYFDDDDDFGLPDLDYDELEDEEDDGETPLVEEVVADTEEEVSLEEPPQEDEPEEKIADNPLASDSKDEDESLIDDEDDDFDISEDDLEGLDLGDIDIDDLSEDDIDEDDTQFYEEESYEDFEGDTAASDIFDADAASALAAEGATAGGEKRYNYSESKSRSSFTKIVVFGTVIIALLAVTLLYFYDGEEPVVEKAPPKKEVVKPKPQPKVEPKVEEPEPEPISQPISAPAGEINKLENPTGNTYVVIGSFFDEDLAEDYAKELANNGQSPTIIPPFASSRFYRVAISSFSSFDEANSALSGFKTDYGEEVWALKY